MTSRKSWVDQMADDAQARLEQLGALGKGDDSLRSPRAVSAMRGLARTIGAMRPVDDFDPEGLSDTLMLLADEMERICHRQVLEAAGRLAA